MVITLCMRQFEDSLHDFYIVGVSFLIIYYDRYFDRCHQEYYSDNDFVVTKEGTSYFYQSELKLKHQDNSSNIQFYKVFCEYFESIS